ncbi:MAG: hypothetical protein ACYDIC_19985 [Desulfobaccales bacterium]
MIAGLLYLILWVVLKTGHEFPFLFIAYIFLVMVLSPGIAALISILSVGSMFKLVSISNVFIGFVSIIASFLALFLAFGLYGIIGRESSKFDFIVGILQYISIFFGALISRKLAKGEN